MKRTVEWRYICGAAFLLVLTFVLLATFSLLGRTDKVDQPLLDSRDERFGWRYEVLVDGEAAEYEPVFTDEDSLVLPEGTQAVRITRTMTEQLPAAELGWHGDWNGVEVFLGEQLLHSDFQTDRRDENGFLRLTEADWERRYGGESEDLRKIRILFPSDYPGEELAVTTYFPDSSYMEPVYPVFGDEDSVVADYIVSSVKYDVVMTVYALLALLMAGMYLLDVHNDGRDADSPLLSLYFLMMFFDAATISYAGYYSVLSVDMTILNRVYMAPLCLYLALKLKKWWKWPLCAAVVHWAMYESVRKVLDNYMVPAGNADSIGPGMLVVFLAVAAARCVEAMQHTWTREEKRRFVSHVLLAVGVTAAYLVNKVRVWGGVGDYLTLGIWESLIVGNYEPLISVVTGITAYVTSIVVVMAVIRRTVRTVRTVDVLRERERLTTESYQRMAAAQESTKALRHEMRHHLNALAGILDSGDTARAAEYLKAVTGEHDQLPVGQYSENILVNVIVGDCMDRARAQHVEEKHWLNLPQELNIQDEELSVFLSNMLQNALEACERMEPDARRYIHLDMHTRGTFLFIRCKNSAPDADPAPHPDHGFGLKAMRAIAEKYHSTLLIERVPGSFSVASDLCLPRR